MQEETAKAAIADASADKPNEDINTHLNDMDSVGGDEEMDGLEELINLVDDELANLPKKRKEA